MQCRTCRAEMDQGARFCPKCGTASLKHRRRLHGEFEQQGGTERRAAWAIACLFAGGILAMFLPGQEELYVNWNQDIGAVVVGFAAIIILGKGSMRQCFAGSATIRQLLIGGLLGMIAFGISSAYVSLLGLLGGSEEARELGFSAIISIVVAAPLIEEWTYRGIAWTAAERIGGPVFTLFLTAALFAMAHGLNGGFVIEFPHRFFGGLVLGWLRMKSGSLLPCIAGHATWNAFAVFLNP